jgi:hypothetical protein
MPTTISRVPTAGNETLLATLRLLALLRSAEQIGIRGVRDADGWLC